MPTAYDLSSVIAGGTNVGHNNLIPLGEFICNVEQIISKWEDPRKHESQWLR